MNSNVFLHHYLVMVVIYWCNSFTIALREEDRVNEYKKRQYHWPPLMEEYTPNNSGWRKLYQHRLHQVEMVGNRSDRYQAYVAALYSALIGPSFTDYGWGITKAPKIVVDRLKKRFTDGMASENKKYERPDVCLEHGDGFEPFHFDDPEKNKEILNELLPFHESWSGVELVPHFAYGLRVYRNESAFNMHLDKSSTHIISGILHVDHGENDEPWPLVIEDYHGNHNEIFLESGDLLFYESSKLLHGRPRTMNGEYYTSLFLHYYPKNWEAERFLQDIHYRVPPSWVDAVLRIDGDETSTLSVIDSTFKELECEDSWCGLVDSKKWYSDGLEYGQYLSGDNKVKLLENIPRESEISKHPQENSEL